MASAAVSGVSTGVTEGNLPVESRTKVEGKTNYTIVHVYLKFLLHYLVTIEVFGRDAYNFQFPKDALNNLFSTTFGCCCWVEGWKSKWVRVIFMISTRHNILITYRDYK